MKIKRLVPDGLILFEPNVFEDERGYFFESFNDIIKKEIGDYEFVQDNESCSAKNVLRGMHFQNPPFEQGKLVRVITGSVIDIAVDMRKKSPTYLINYSIELSGINKNILWIPPGFAHGFVTLEDRTIFSYKCTNIYNKPSESGVLWNDNDLKLDWKVSNPVLSSKDLQLPALVNVINLFE